MRAPRICSLMVSTRQKEVANARHLVGSYQGGIGQAGQPPAACAVLVSDAGVEDPGGGSLISSV